MASLLEKVIRLSVDTTPAEDGFRRIGDAANNLTTMLTDQQQKVYQGATEAVQRQVDENIRQMERLYAKQEQANKEIIKSENEMAHVKQTNDDTEIASVQKKLDKAKSAHDTFAHNVEKLEIENTKILERELNNRDNAVARSLKHQETLHEQHQRQVSAQLSAMGGRAAMGFGREMMQGSGIPMPFMGGGLPGMIGMGGGLGAGLAIKSTIEDVVKLADAVHQLQIQGQGSAEQMSTMAAVASRFGVSIGELESMMNRLKTNMVDQPKQFEALGIALKNTDGSARHVADVFADLRTKLANSNQDASAMQVATELLGRSAYEILPYLTASGAAIDKVGESVAGTAEVMNEDGIKKAKDYELASKAMGVTMHDLALEVGMTLLPVLTNAFDGIGQAFDTLGRIISTVGAVLLHNFGQIGQAIGHFMEFKWDQIGNDLGGMQIADLSTIGQAFDAAQAAHDRSVADRKERVDNETKIGNPGGTDLSGDTRKALSDAHGQQMKDLQEEIKAIEDKAKAEEQEMRDHLKAYEREHQASLEKLKDEEQVKVAAHEAEIKRIEDEVKVYEEAYKKREEARQTNIRSLRDQISLIEQQVKLEQSQAALDSLQRTLDDEKNHQVFISKSDTEETYQRNVYEHNKRLKDDERKLADERKKIAIDEQKTILEDRIKAIEAAALADRRAADEFKQHATDRISKIHEQMAEEKKQFDAKVKQITEEMAKERERIDDAIQAEQRHTATVVAELQKRLSAYSSNAASVNALYRPITVPVTYRITTIGTPPSGGAGVTPGNGQGPDAIDRANAASDEAVRQAYRDFLGREPENEGAVIGRRGRSIDEIRAEIGASEEARNHAAVVVQHPNGQPMADGGSFWMTEPAKLIGQSGKVYANSDTDEPVIFGGIGGKALRGDTNSGSITVNVTVAGSLVTEKQMVKAAVDGARRAISAEVSALAAEGFGRIR